MFNRVEKTAQMQDSSNNFIELGHYQEQEIDQQKSEFCANEVAHQSLSAHCQSHPTTFRNPGFSEVSFWSCNMCIFILLRLWGL